MSFRGIVLGSDPKTCLDGTGPVVLGHRDCHATANVYLECGTSVTELEQLLDEREKALRPLVAWG
jgi:hypothetical protein